MLIGVPNIKKPASFLSEILQQLKRDLATCGNNEAPISFLLFLISYDFVHILSGDVAIGTIVFLLRQHHAGQYWMLQEKDDSPHDLQLPYGDSTSTPSISLSTHATAFSNSLALLLPLVAIWNRNVIKLSWRVKVCGCLWPLIQYLSGIARSFLLAGHVLYTSLLASCLHEIA